MGARKLVLMAGLPRSGKSTIARKMGHPIVNPDSIRIALTGQRFFGPAEPFVWATAYAMAEALFLAGHETVVIDATNITLARRAPWHALAERLGADTEIEIAMADPATCRARAEAEGDTEILPVIDRMAGTCDLPVPWRT